MNDVDMNIEMDDRERIELEREKQLRDDVQWLLKQDAFKRAIGDVFIRGTALNVGSRFDDTEEQKRALFAVSYLNAFLTNHSE